MNQAYRYKGEGSKLRPDAVYIVWVTTSSANGSIIARVRTETSVIFWQSYGDWEAFEKEWSDV